MPYKKHTKTFKDNAIMLWDLNLALSKCERMTQRKCAEFISNELGSNVTYTTIKNWINGQNVKNEYEQELEEFIEQLLINEQKLKERIKELESRV